MIRLGKVFVQEAKGEPPKVTFVRYCGECPWVFNAPMPPGYACNHGYGVCELPDAFIKTILRYEARVRFDDDAKLANACHKPVGETHIISWDTCLDKR